MPKYLDDTGLAYLWGKLKTYIDAHSGGGGSNVVITYDSTAETIYITTNVSNGDGVSY